MNRLAVWTATCGPTGYAPVAPGTAGSAIGLVAYLYISRWSLEAQIIFALALTAVGVWAASEAAQHFGKPDPSQVVIDEVAGQVVTLVGLGTGWFTIVLGFLVFRALDIIKPWPANRLEALHGGAGIMADDVMAAAYGQLVMRGAILLLPGWF